MEKDGAGGGSFRRKEEDEARGAKGVNEQRSFPSALFYWDHARGQALHYSSCETTFNKRTTQ